MWPRRKTVAQQRAEVQDELHGKRDRLLELRLITENATHIPGMLVRERLDVAERVAVLEMRLVRLEGER